MLIIKQDYDLVCTAQTILAKGSLWPWPQYSKSFILEEFAFCVNYPFFIAFPYMLCCFQFWTLTKGLPQHHNWVNLEILPALFCKDSIVQSHILFHSRWCDVWRELLHVRFQDANPVHRHGHSSSTSVLPVSRFMTSPATRGQLFIKLFLCW